MAKARITGQADDRPRVYLMQRGDSFRAAGHPAAAQPWTEVDSLHDAVDLVAGEGAHLRPAVIMWEGVSTDG